MNLNWFIYTRNILRYSGMLYMYWLYEYMNSWLLLFSVETDFLTICFVVFSRYQYFKVLVDEPGFVIIRERRWEARCQIKHLPWSSINPPCGVANSCFTSWTISTMETVEYLYRTVRRYLQPQNQRRNLPYPIELHERLHKCIVLGLTPFASSCVHDLALVKLWIMMAWLKYCTKLVCLGILILFLLHWS